ncbi:MAG: DUF4139 domain-containing protein [Bacteroidales bacterium]
MKTPGILFSLMIMFTITYAGEETKLQTTPDKITVYTNGAEISRKANFAYSQKRQTIVFDSLSPYLKDNSIQVQGHGDFTILDVKYRMQQPDPLHKDADKMPPRIKKEIKLLEDSIRLKGYTVTGYQNKLEVLQTEKDLLLNNSLISGNGGDTIPELRETLIFLRKKLNNINEEILRITREKYPHEQTYSRMKNRLTELKAWNQQKNTNTSEQSVPQVVVNIAGNSKGKGSIELSYLVNNAGWNASYDIRASENEEINLVYKANIYQNTGSDWEDVKLTLSTLNPNQNQYKPVLPVWYAYYIRPHNETVSRDGNRTTAVAQSQSVSLAEDKESAQAYQHTNAVSSMLNVEYQVNLDFTIPSDGKHHTVPIQNKNLGADFSYYAAPKLDNKAYLMAQITDWQDLDLLQGKANLYFNGKYNGQTNITPQTTNDSMEITLGRANGIIIEHEKESSEEKPQIVGSWVTETVTYKISIRNTTSRKIKIRVEDNIPHSTTKDLEVKLKNSDGAEFNEDNSHLSWDLNLAAGKTKTRTYSFDVKYDKDKPVNLNL